MKLSDYVDIEKLRATLENEPPRRCLCHLTEVAQEAAPANHRKIAILFGAYNECTTPELTTDKLLSYLESLMWELGDDENRRRFLQAVDPTALKWDRWRCADH